MLGTIPYEIVTRVGARGADTSQTEVWPPPVQNPSLRSSVMWNEKS